MDYDPDDLDDLDPNARIARMLTQQLMERLRESYTYTADLRLEVCASIGDICDDAALVHQLLGRCKSLSAELMADTEIVFEQSECTADRYRELSAMLTDLVLLYVDANNAHIEHVREAHPEELHQTMTDNNSDVADALSTVDKILHPPAGEG